MSAIVVARGVASVFFPGLGIEKSLDSGTAGEHGLVFLDPSVHDASIFDRAVLRGDGFFEAISVIDGTIPVSLDLHVERLAVSAAMLDMPQPDVRAFREACLEIISKYSGGHDDPMLRILISRGLDPGTGEGVREGAGLPSVWFYLDGEGDKHSTQPLRMVSLDAGFLSTTAAAAPWLLLGVKKLSYAVNMAAEREAHRRGYDDALFITSDGHVLESPHASVVARFGDEFVTPDPTIGILHGTSQQEFFAYARRQGCATRYADITLERFKTADAVFQTRGGWVIPVSALDDVDYSVDQRFVEEANHAIHYEQPAQIAELAHD